VLREHPQIEEAAVVGVPDEVWGECVAAAIVLREGVTESADAGQDAARTGAPVPAGPLTLDALRAWGADRLAPYKLPTRLSIEGSLPRNPMGKVEKPKVRALFEERAARRGVE